MSWNKRSPKLSICTKSLFLSDFVHKFVYITVSEHFSFAKIIHPTDRCGISRSWLNSRIITQVHFVLGTIKGHSKVLREQAIGMLTAVMSARAVVREFKANFSTISRLQCCFREFGSSSNLPHNRRPRVSTPAQEPPHPASLPVGLSETSHPDCWWNWGIFMSVIKPFVWKNSFWLAGTAPKWVALFHHRPTHGCSPAQSCEIHR